MATIQVLDSYMSFRETGAGGVPVVLLHGNPTSSYLWRNVTPGIARHCIAPDLIGMGESGKPAIAYRFADHARYLEAWFEAMNLGEVVLVGHDWGGALAMDWASRHPGRVQKIAVLETFLRPVRWDELTPLSAELFRGYRSAKGEEMVLDNNMLVEVNLGRNVMRPMADADLAVYRAPYPTRASRLPMLQWTREFPLDGEPADVAEIVRRYGVWMNSTPNIPKLVMAVENGSGLGSPEMVGWAAEHFANVVVTSIGPASHQAPEDQPERIAAAIAEWL